MYCNVVHHAAFYGSECSPITEEKERRLAVMDMKILRYTSGVTRHDDIRKIRILAIDRRFHRAKWCNRSRRGDPLLKETKTDEEEKLMSRLERLPGSAYSSTLK